jgi:hypothetical protein
MTPGVVMDTMEALQPFPPELVNADGSWKGTKERRKGERMQIHCLTKKRVDAYVIEQGHKIAKMSQDLLVENLMGDGTCSSMISRWISKTLEWQAEEANTSLISWVRKKQSKISLKDSSSTVFFRNNLSCPGQFSLC